MKDVGLARLTPGFEAAFTAGEGPEGLQGQVHSLFKRVINVVFPLAEGPCMLTLCAEDVPRLPDSIALPAQWLDRAMNGLRIQMPVFLREDSLKLGDMAVRLQRGGARECFLRAQAGTPAVCQLLCLDRDTPSGFDRLPPSVRAEAERGLIAGDAQRWLGLGAGLTPSFDDACVGAMAACRALGRSVPFRLTDLSGTTDVSARYIRLAQSGYFGEPLCALVEAIYQGELTLAAEKLLRVGATSGADMLHGVALIMKEYA